MEMCFGATNSYTVGVEEEFQLVDPSTRELAPAIEGVIGAYLENTERMAPELFQDCVELRTPCSRPSRSWLAIFPLSDARSRRRREEQGQGWQHRGCTRSPTPSHRGSPAGSATSGWRRN